MPVEQFVSDLPSVLALEESEYVRGTGVHTCQLSRPTLHFQVNYGNRADNLDAGEARIQIWRRTVHVDPFEHVIDRAIVLHSLAESGNRRVRMESWSHEVCITGHGTGNVTMHHAGNRVVLNQITIGLR